MTGDRRLQEHEMRVFMQHGTIGLNTVKELLFTGGEPTLFEVAFLEIIAKVDAHTQVLVNQGAVQGELGEIMDRLEMSLKLFNTRLNELDESLEEVKKPITDQIEELRELVKELRD